MYICTSLVLVWNFINWEFWCWVPPPPPLAAPVKYHLVRKDLYQWWATCMLTIRSQWYMVFIPAKCKCKFELKKLCPQIFYSSLLCLGTQLLCCVFRKDIISCQARQAKAEEETCSDSFAYIRSDVTEEYGVYRWLSIHIYAWCVPWTLLSCGILSYKTALSGGFI